MTRLACAFNLDMISFALKRILKLPNGDDRNKKSAKRLALEVAITLESFSISCMDIVFANRICYNEKFPVGIFRRSLPELGSRYLSDDGWRFMSRVLAVEMSTFTDAISLADETVKKAWETDVPSPAWVICSAYCANLGQRAAVLATNVREAHGQSDATPDWNRCDRLMIEMRRIEEDEAAWQARRIETERAQSESGLRDK